jgi:hypothetical protein
VRSAICTYTILRKKKSGIPLLQTSPMVCVCRWCVDDAAHTLNFFFHTHLSCVSMAHALKFVFLFLIALRTHAIFFPPGDTDKEGKPHGQGFFIHRDKPVKGVNFLKSTSISGFE